MAVRGDDLITSALAPGELLLKPLAVGDRLLADQYERMLFLPGVRVVPFTERAARIYGTLRADKNLRAPDAIQLASAAAADMLVTNDARLSRRIIPGIHFITSLEQAVRRV